MAGNRKQAMHVKDPLLLRMSNTWESPGENAQHDAAREEFLSYESADYIDNQSTVFFESERGRSLLDMKRVDLYGWVIVFAIGVCTALVAFFIDMGTKVRLTRVCARWPARPTANACCAPLCAAFVRLQGISHYKFKWVYGLIGDERHPSLGVAFVVFVLINAGLAAVAAYLVAYVEPVAAGSGIPEIKCYLNGVKVPRVVRFKTLLTKAIGVLFSVGSNLAVGREGPMIASGSVIGGGLSQGKSSSMAFDTQLFRSFRSDRQKRDTVTAGASAGVAAAFGAPVGGVLFSLEEGASFWNQSLTWRVFFCSMISTFTLNTLLSGTEGDESSGWGHLS